MISLLLKQLNKVNWSFFDNFIFLTLSPTQWRHLLMWHNVLWLKMTGQAKSVQWYHPQSDWVRVLRSGSDQRSLNSSFFWKFYFLTLFPTQCCHPVTWLNILWLKMTGQTRSLQWYHPEPNWFRALRTGSDQRSVN